MKKVLIVDDSNTNNFLLQSVLDAEGIPTLVAFDGKQALDILKVEKPSLILLDIMMPELDGFIILEKLKADPVTQNIPVIIITARNEDDLMEKAVNAGADNMLQKPIDIEKVIKMVKSPVTGAYMFKEEVITNDVVKDYFQKQ